LQISPGELGTCRIKVDVAHSYDVVMIVERDGAFRSVRLRAGRARAASGLGQSIPWFRGRSSVPLRRVQLTRSRPNDPPRRVNGQWLGVRNATALGSRSAVLTTNDGVHH
jgi:hypothetical protein